MRARRTDPDTNDPLATLARDQDVRDADDDPC
jgi:hypothetical protein